MTCLNNIKKHSEHQISKNVWDTLELCEAKLDDSRLHDSKGRCSMCGKKTDVALHSIPDPIEGDTFYHWVCDTCMEILEKNGLK